MTSAVRALEGICADPRGAARAARGSAGPAGRQAGSVIILDSTDSDATVRGLVRSGITFTDLEVTGAGLEDAFLALTSEEHQ